MARKKISIKPNPEKMISLDELVKDFSDTQLLYLIGEMLLLEVDEKAETEYEKGEEPHSLVFKMQSGRQIAVTVKEK